MSRMVRLRSPATMEPSPNIGTRTAPLSVMRAMCAALPPFMASPAGIDPLTAYLATSPGGADSIAIIAASTDVDVSFVMAMQTVRLLVVLFAAPYITKIIADPIGRVGKG